MTTLYVVTDKFGKHAVTIQGRIDDAQAQTGLRTLFHNSQVRIERIGEYENHTEYTLNEVLGGGR